jgi:hypothetical protein
VVRDPNLFSVWAYRYAHRIDSNVYAGCNAPAFGVNDVKSIAWGVDDKNTVSENGNGLGMGADKGGMTD